MYQVIQMFTDLKDNGYKYNFGDEYPHKGYSPTKERIKELLSAENKQGKPLIVKKNGKPVTEVEEVEEIIDPEELTEVEEVENTPRRGRPKKQ